MITTLIYYPKFFKVIYNFKFFIYKVQIWRILKGISWKYNAFKKKISSILY